MLATNSTPIQMLGDAMPDILSAYVDWLADLYARRDPSLAHLPLAGTPTVPILVLIVYVWLVFVGLPAYMRGRQAYSLRWFMLAYNALQVAMNTYMTFWCLNHALNNLHHVHCIPTQPDNTYGSYLYNLNKYIDLIETPVFVLRHKRGQVSFLHVYHHIMVVSCSYITLCIQPGGQIWFYGMMNCLVHAVMYSYYFCSTFDRRLLCDSRWLTKKNVTRLQLLQFVLVSAHLGVPWFFGLCDYSPFLTRVALFQCSFMTLLFAQFYYKTYIRAERVGTETLPPSDKNGCHRKSD